MRCGKLILMLVIAFCCSASLLHAQTVESVKTEIKSLEGQLEELHSEQANYREIRKIQIRLEDKKKQLQDLINAQTMGAIESGFEYLEEQFSKALSDVGPRDFISVFNQRVRGQVVRLIGYVVLSPYSDVSPGKYNRPRLIKTMVIAKGNNPDTPGYGIAYSYHGDRNAKYVSRLCYINNKPTFYLAITLGNPLRQHDLSLLLGRERRPVFIEGVVNSVVFDNDDDNIGSLGNYYQSKIGNEWSKFIDSIQITDWILIDKNPIE